MRLWNEWLLQPVCMKDEPDVEERAFDLPRLDNDEV